MDSLRYYEDGVASQMRFRKSLTIEEAMQKLRHYCAYQERCQEDVRTKLFSLGIMALPAGQLIARLIEEDVLNEERYAIQFAGGKFRIKHWGKLRIRAALKQRKISEYCIRKALESIDPADYEKTLRDLGEKKWALLKDIANPYIKHHQTAIYLQQKGFEPEQIQSMIRSLP